MWQTIVRKNYGIVNGIFRVIMKQNDSAVWKDLLKVKHIFLYGRSMVIGDGKSIDFWNGA
jgi:hypothetical protein